MSEIEELEDVKDIGEISETGPVSETEQEEEDFDDRVINLDQEDIPEKSGSTADAEAAAAEEKPLTRREKGRLKRIRKKEEKARLREERWKRRKKNFLLGLLEYAVLLGLLYVVFHYVFGVSFVHGMSMYPTLQDGQLAFYTRIQTNYSVGNIVVVEMPSGALYVKRVVAAGGDTVDIADGVVYVNGEEIDSSYSVGTTNMLNEDITYPLTLYGDQYFVMGDNRENSVDSREFGPVDDSQIQGRLLYYAGKLF